MFNDQSFNDTLTKNIVSFEQLGPGSVLLYIYCFLNSYCRRFGFYMQAGIYLIIKGEVSRE